MNSFIEYLVILLFILILLIILFVIRKQKVVYTSLISGFLLILVVYLIIMFSNLGNPSGQLIIDNYIPTDQIVLNNNKLSYASNNELIVKNDLTDRYPIYLKELEHYYLIVYSKDKDKVLTRGLYVQYDYEYYSADVDRLYLISKETGKFSAPSMYQTIGSTLNLDLSLNHQGTILIPVYKPFTLELNYYYVLMIYENENIFHILNDKIAIPHQKEVTKLAFLDGLFVVLYNDNSISFQTSTPLSVSHNEGSFSISYSGRYYDLLDNQIYAKQGYFKTHKDTLYIVGNDLGLYKFHNGLLILVKQLTSIDVWETEIDKL